MKHKVCLLVEGEEGQKKPKGAEIHARVASARMFPCFCFKASVEEYVRSVIVRPPAPLRSRLRDRLLQL